jgi:two-component system response regulator HydG
MKRNYENLDGCLESFRAVVMLTVVNLTGLHLFFREMGFMDIARHWKTIFDTLQDGLMVVDPNGSIMAMNPAAERLTGYAADELVGRSCRSLNCTGCKILENSCGSTFCSLYEDGRVRAKKCTITDKNGRTVHILKNASVLHDEGGQVIGAVETLTDMSEVVRQQQEILSLRKTLHLEDGFHGILGKSPVMQGLFELIENVSLSDAPVTIHGQSGTGKEMVARAVHDAGPRKDQPFIKVNCAALNENLLESELFGHVKGAFTGADRTRIGRFEAAHGGTIFLDEIGDIPLSTQVKLLRVLEEKEIERVGDHRPIHVNVRIVSATHQDLEKLIREGRFREDLFFRLNVFPLVCPELTERTEDIPVIVQHFIRQNAKKSGKKILGLTPEAIERLTAYHWPGNVRELRNAVEYAFVLCPGGGIGIEHLPPKITQRAFHQPVAVAASDPTRAALIDALRKNGGNQSAAARALGVSRVTIWKRMRKYEVDLHADIMGHPAPMNGRTRPDKPENIQREDKTNGKPLVE